MRGALLLGLSSLFLSACQTTPEEDPMKRLTPILLVDEIEPSLEFWVGRVGFEVTAEVPNETDGKLVFVSMSKGAFELMFQTHASVSEDMATFPDLRGRSSTVLFIEVEDLDVIESAMDGVPRTFERRETFYGSTEIGVRAPGEHFVTFARFAPQG